MGKVAHITKNIGSIDSKGEADTIRLWENYREQATLWRVIALAQMLGTTLLICFAFYIYSTRTVTLHVPRNPLPGQYAINEIPHEAVVEAGTELVNLIATYQSHVAEKQFVAALQMLDEPALSQFKDEMLGLELKAIKSTSRTQVFFVDPLKTKVELTPHGLKVTFIGERVKFISGKQVPTTITSYAITFSTLPRNMLNPYGLVANNIVVKNMNY